MIRFKSKNKADGPDGPWLGKKFRSDPDVRRPDSRGGERIHAAIAHSGVKPHALISLGKVPHPRYLCQRVEHSEEFFADRSMTYHSQHPLKPPISANVPRPNHPRGTVFPSNARCAKRPP